MLSHLPITTRRHFRYVCVCACIGVCVLVFALLHAAIIVIRRRGSISSISSSRIRIEQSFRVIAVGFSFTIITKIATTFPVIYGYCTYKTSKSSSSSSSSSQPLRSFRWHLSLPGDDHVFPGSRIHPFTTPVTTSIGNMGTY